MSQVTEAPVRPILDQEVERILVVVAHPDDVDFGGAGTVASWTASGIDVSYCVITDGQAGGFDPGLDRADMPAIRRQEQRSAAEHVGVRDVRFLGYVDGELSVSRELVRDLARVMRQVRPQRVLVQSPERNWGFLAPSHPDHLAGGEAATQALYPASGNPFAFTELLDDEGLEPWSAREVWLMEHPSSNHAVDVTESIDAKLAALGCHESQHRDPQQIATLLREQLADNAARHGMAPGRLAEVFAVYPLP
ncbi:MAG: LmbE family protein [uncultured Nocardioidaceae bacterium]|uniref:LmbE family protein n=1 Tax=uncultured Nocardioidaceae bacterium TaxID=253824 RepID=A0A6J4LH69_9ACTN|nr:MAG: LmbE family protein [uncultured Nocardioidaceae bacterium]